jgi:hypothetical protein
VRLDRPTSLWDAVRMTKTSRIIVSAGTGRIWTGIGLPLAGPGIYGGGRTQQPGLEKNPSRGSVHLLSPAERNAIAPSHVIPPSAWTCGRC